MGVSGVWLRFQFIWPYFTSLTRLKTLGHPLNGFPAKGQGCQLFSLFSISSNHSCLAPSYDYGEQYVFPAISYIRGKPFPVWVRIVNRPEGEWFVGESMMSTRRLSLQIVPLLLVGMVLWFGNLLGFLRWFRIKRLFLVGFCLWISTAFLPAQNSTIAPELVGGVDWLNTSKPVSLRALRGKIVLLDFWTLCCINCIHIMPDLEKLEKKYPKELVVIGIHSPKFENEKDSENIKKAILRYEIKHPVVNDANKAIWNAYGANWWPTIVLIDPDGNVVGAKNGEGNYAQFDTAIAGLVEKFTANGKLKLSEPKWDLLKESSPETLRFPGKVINDPISNRIFIADSTNHRIVITDKSGKMLDVVGGGGSGSNDGDYVSARFNDPQGVALKGNLLYVADRKNHLLRVIDLDKKTVKKIAGTGKQGKLTEPTRGKPLSIGLNSPWDLLIHKNQLFIAMAGHHQIWVMELDGSQIRVFAGNGTENIKDGPPSQANFAQPSALATDGVNLYVADSETSSVRAVPLSGQGTVRTIVGSGLFTFGDIDGLGPKVRLQHALGLTWLDGKLFVADTYNDKLKTLDPKTKSAKEFLKGFDEPGGVFASGGLLYVADTNNHRIMIVDPKTKTSDKLNITGLELPKVSE